MLVKESFRVLANEHGQRIDLVCAQRFPKISRSQWSKRGSFYCNNILKTGKSKAKEGDVWNVECDMQVFNDEIIPWNFSLKILEEHDDWVVIDKPYGISVHPSISDNSQETIINALVHHFGKNLSENYDEIEGKKVPRPGLVHRLDKTTSGVLLVAKNNAAHSFFQSHWSEFEKTYMALVSGRPPEEGRIESGIVRDPYDRKKMMASDTDKAKWAITEFKKLEQRGNEALMAIKILTGRTHQIRVHMSSIGFPVVGDVLYGGIEADRVMLHAESLKFFDTKSEFMVSSKIVF